MTQHYINHDLYKAEQYAYKPNGLIITNLNQELESQQYGACTFDINNKHILFRVGKITPTKAGQFVTLWKRIDAGPIIPYDITDTIDLITIHVNNVNNTQQMGQFVFPKTLLLYKGFMSTNGIGGKRAMRIYPPWDITTNQQARNTQKWQLDYFFEIKMNSDVDSIRIRKLFYQL